MKQSTIIVIIIIVIIVIIIAIGLKIYRDKYLARAEAESKVARTGVIISYHRMWLRRDPTPDEITNALNEINIGSKFLTDVETDLKNSLEANNIFQTFITNMYTKWLYREPNDVDLKIWTTIFKEGKTDKDVEKGIKSSTEYNYVSQIENEFRKKLLRYNPTMIRKYVDKIYNEGKTLEQVKSGINLYQLSQE